MGMFGLSLGAPLKPGAVLPGQFDPSQMSGSDRLMLMGAMLKDMGSGLRGGDTGSVLGMQQLLAQRQMLAARNAYLQRMYGGGGAAGGAAGGGAGGAAGGGGAGGGWTPPSAADVAYGENVYGLELKDAVHAQEVARPDMQLGPDNVYRNKYDSSYGGQPLVGVTPGQVAVPGPNGEGVTNAPGALAATARGKLAESLGTGIGAAATDLATVTPNGVPQQESRLNALRDSGGLGLENLDSMLGGSPLVPQAGAGGPAAAPGTPAPGTPAQAPAAAPAPPVRPVQKGAAPQAQRGPIVGVSADTQAYRTAQATDAAGRYKAYQDAAAGAPGAISRLRMMDNLLTGVRGGKFAPQTYEIASAMHSLGFNVDPKLPNKDAAAVLERSMASEAMKNPDTGANMFPRVTNFEYENALKQVPGLLQTEAGRHLVVEMKVREQQRIGDIGSKARAWNQRYGRIDAPDQQGHYFQDYLDAWSAKHPLYEGLKIPGMTVRR